MTKKNCKKTASLLVAGLCVYSAVLPASAENRTDGWINLYQKGRKGYLEIKVHAKGKSKKKYKYKFSVCRNGHRENTIVRTAEPGRCVCRTGIKAAGKYSVTAEVYRGSERLGSFSDYFNASTVGRFLFHVKRTKENKGVIYATTRWSRH